MSNIPDRLFNRSYSKTHDQAIHEVSRFCMAAGWRVVIDQNSFLRPQAVQADGPDEHRVQVFHLWEDRWMVKFYRGNIIVEDYNNVSETGMGETTKRWVQEVSIATAHAL